MKVIILAAGYATRLYPLTLNTPKPLLLINNKPIINYIIDNVMTLSCVDFIYVVTNNRFACEFYNWQRQYSYSNLKIINDGTNDEENRLGAIGDISFVIRDQKINEDTMIIAGDSFFTFSLTSFYDYFCKFHEDCVCAKRLNSDSELTRFAIASVDLHNKLINLEEKPKVPKSNIVVYATYIYQKETLLLIEEYLKEKNIPDAPGYFLQWLYTKKNVRVYEFDGEFYDIGTINSLQSVRNKFNDKSIKQ
jgi:glucose-1-phosphate thymidylyltransferase